jgi:hypothetical protein
MTVSEKKLKTDSTKDEGMNVVAKYYKVEQDWNDYENSNRMDHTRPEKYFNLLMIVKAKSDVNNVWVTFIEGSHQHSGILFCLICSSFDYAENEIKQGSLKMRDLKKCKHPSLQSNKERACRPFGRHFRRQISSRYIDKVFSSSSILPHSSFY